MAMNYGSNEGVTTNVTFHKRFDVDLEIEHENAREAFVNHILDGIEEKLRYLEFTGWGFGRTSAVHALKLVALRTGERHKYGAFRWYVNDFRTCLLALEALSEAFAEQNDQDKQDKLTQIIESAVASSELDLGIKWRNGKFWPSGERLLDEALVERWTPSLGQYRSNVKVGSRYPQRVWYY